MLVKPEDSSIVPVDFINPIESISNSLQETHKMNQSIKKKYSDDLLYLSEIIFISKFVVNKSEETNCMSTRVGPYLSFDMFDNVIAKYFCNFVVFCI